MMTPQTKWDKRYRNLSPDSQVNPTPFVVKSLDHLPKKGWALDIAAGAGRNSIALTQRGLSVDAVDISGQGLRLLKQRAASAQLASKIYCIMADVERDWLPQRDYDVVLVSYFLHRPLFPLIKQQLKPGGWLIYQTFTTDSGHKLHAGNVRFYLEPDELRQAFSEFNQLFYDEVYMGDQVVAQLLAIRPSTVDG